MSPMLKAVEEAGIKALYRKRSPFSYEVADFFEPVHDVKSIFSRLINCNDPDRIAIIPSVSYGLANVVKNINLKTGEDVILAAEQFPSNVYPWMETCRSSGANLVMVEAPSAVNNRGESWNMALLQAITENTAVVAMGHVHWADGTLFNLEAIREKCDTVGALMIIDGTQSVGALPFDVQKIRPDALICAGYKWLLGPYSIGVAYYGEYFDDGESIEHNWINRVDSEDFPNLVNYQELVRPKAGRYNVGETSNFLLVPMLKAALQQIEDWGVENIQRYCAEITSESIHRIEQLGYEVESLPFRASHLFGIRLPKIVLKETLVQNLAQADVKVSQRGDAIRISPHLYNARNDIERLVQCLEVSLPSTLTEGNRYK